MSLLLDLFERAQIDETDADMDDWLTVGQCSTLWQLHQNTIYRYLRDNKIPCRIVRLGGRNWRIHGGDARALVFSVNHFLIKAEEPPETNG